MRDHHGDGFAGIAAARSFRRKHDGIAAVENGIGHVAGFGACGPRVFDHRLKHLGGRDHRLAPLGGAADHMLLNDWNFFRRHFHAQIAAGDHHAIGSFEDFFQVVDGLRLFQFRDQQACRCRGR